MGEIPNDVYESASRHLLKSAARWGGRLAVGVVAVHYFDSTRSYLQNNRLLSNTRRPEHDFTPDDAAGENPVQAELMETKDA